MQYRLPAASVQPGRPSDNQWFQSPAALGLSGSLAALTLISADLFFIASQRLLADHLLMIGYWVGVGVLSTVGLCVLHRHRWLIELSVRLPLLAFVLGWAMLSTLWSQDPAFTAGRALALYLEVVLGIFIGFACSPRQVMAILTWTFAGLLVLNLACPLLAPEEGLQHVTRSGVQSWKGITVNRNQLGAVAAAAAVFFLVALRRRRLPRLPALAGCLLGAFLVYMTRSATALILLVAFAR
jgi:hypothetical protein